MKRFKLEIKIKINQPKIQKTEREVKMPTVQQINTQNKPKKTGKYFDLCGPSKALMVCQRHIDSLSSMGVDFHSALEDFYDNMSMPQVMDMFFKTGRM